MWSTKLKYGTEYMINLIQFIYTLVFNSQFIFHTNRQRDGTWGKYINIYKLDTMSELQCEL